MAAALDAARAPTLLDRVIGVIDPVRAAARMQARMTMALASGGYAGASRARRSMQTWTTSGADADGDILPALPVLRERSRDLIRNNPLAAGAVNTKCANVVGTGLWLKSEIDAEYLGMTEEEADAWQRNTEREFRMWSESADCDIARTLNFYALQDLAYRSTVENGDAFALLTYAERPGRIYSSAVQLIEADRVSNPQWQRDSAKVSGGVEREESGAPVAYHVLRAHPGAVNRLSKGLQWDRVEAFGGETGRRNMLHLYRSLRVGQSRGVPELAPVIEALKQLGDYTEAELTAAVVSGMFTVFVKSEDGAGLGPMGPTAETGASASDSDYRMASGAILDLAPGESIETANPGRPNQAFDPFVQAILRQVGVALELPFELLVMHFTSSYSAARAALLQAWKFFRARRAWLADNFCQPIYEAWMTEAVALGRIAAPGFLHDPAIRAAYLGADWIGDAPGQIDPLKEAQAAKLMEEMTWKTATENTAELTGGDWDRKVRRRGREQALKRQLQITDGDAPAAPVVSDDEDKDQDDDATDDDEA